MDAVPIAPRKSLRVERIRLGLSQAALASLVDAHVNTIRLAEKTDRVSYKLARKLAPVLGCHVMELVS